MTRALHDELASLRVLLGLTLDGMAKLLARELGSWGMDRVDRQTVWRWEQGEQRPHPATARVLKEWIANKRRNRGG